MLNTVVLMGRLTYEPELRSTPSGISVSNFQIACDRQYQAKGEDRKADFIDCQAWRQTAEFLDRYFHKGDMVALTGSIQTDNYTDKDGNKRKSVIVSVDNISFCGSKNGGNNNSNQNVTNQGQVYSTADKSDFEEIVDDDLPF